MAIILIALLIPDNNQRITANRSMVIVEIFLPIGMRQSAAYLRFFHPRDQKDVAPRAIFAEISQKFRKNFAEISREFRGRRFVRKRVIFLHRLVVF